MQMMKLVFVCALLVVLCSCSQECSDMEFAGFKAAGEALVAAHDKVQIDDAIAKLCEEYSILVSSRKSISKKQIIELFGQSELLNNQNMLGYTFRVNDEVERRVIVVMLDSYDMVKRIEFMTSVR